MRRSDKLSIYRGADKSLARPRMKQANVSFKTTWISFGALPCRKKKNWWQLASRICWNCARPDMVPSLFPSWSGYGLISTPVHNTSICSVGILYSGMQCHYSKTFRKKLFAVRKSRHIAHPLSFQALGAPEGTDSRISRQFAHEGGKVVSPK